MVSGSWMAGKKEAQFAFGKQRGARLVKSERTMLGILGH